MVEGVSLEDISKSHDFVVFDTSIVLGLDGNRRGDFSLDKVENVFKFCSNLMTVQEVLEECPSYTHSYLRNLVIRPSRYGGTFHDVYLFLRPRAVEAGVVDMKKRQPYTDLYLAAMALTIAHKSRSSQSTAFVSSDRVLNNLVCDARDDLLEGSERYVLSLNKLDIYSFVQKRSIFIPFEEERARASI